MTIPRLEFVDEEQEEVELRDFTIEMQIKPGIPEGTRLIFPEAGDQGPTKIPADVIFITCNKPHERFRRDGHNLHMNQKISLKEALTGFKLSVETIDHRKLDFLITDVVE